MGDSRHLSHRLVSLGMRPPLAVATIYLIALGIGLGAVGPRPRRPRPRAPHPGAGARGGGGGADPALLRAARAAPAGGAVRVALCALAALALAAIARAAEPEVRAVRVTTLDFRAALRVLTVGGRAGRRGGARGRGGRDPRRRRRRPEGLALPALEKPLEAIRVEREPGAHDRCASRSPRRCRSRRRHEPGMLTVVFGEQPAPELRGPVTPELYQRLFPTGAQGTGARPRRTSRPRRRGRARGSRSGRVDAAALRDRRAGWTRTSWPSTAPSRCATSTCRSRPGVTASTAAPRRACWPPSTSRASASSPTSRR